MPNSVYQINKGINKPVEFKGLKAQYIWYLAIGLIALLFLFAFLYIIGLSAIICLIVVLISGIILTLKIFAWSNKYGEFGLLKHMAHKRIPKSIKITSRKVFKKSNLLNQEDK